MSVFVATPTTRQFDPQHVASLIYMYKPEGMIWSYLEGQPIDLARNILTDKFLKHPERPEYLLLVDSDATWHPDALLRLLSRDLPVVTACIYRRRLPPVPTLGPFAHPPTVNEHHNYNFGWTISKILDHAARHGIDADTNVENAITLPETPGDIQEIDGCGMHFCLIRRDVIETIEPLWFKSTSVNAGEDFYFCRKAQAAGFKIYVDLSVHTGHVIGPGADVGLRELIAFYTHTGILDAAKEIWAA